MVLPWDMVDNLISRLRRHSSWMFVIGQARQATTSRCEAASECFCWHLHRLPCDMTLLPQLTCVALKRKPTAKGKRAPRASSIVDGFCRLPSLASVAGNVERDVCHLALVAARASHATMCEDVQNDSRRATTPDGSTGMGTAEQWPRCDAPAQPRRDGRSNSRAQ
jgi:hypothetical protein